MWRRLSLAAIALSVAMTTARAEERAGSAALGALSGAIVLGPVGAVAGAVVGYTAGPAIARSWGLSAPPPRKRRAAPQRASRQAASDPAMSRAEASPQHTGSVPLPPRAPARAARSATPPVQGFESPVTRCPICGTLVPRAQGRTKMSTLSSPAPTDEQLVPTLARYWWLILLRGIAAILFGVLAFIWPGLTLWTLVLFWGAFVLVDGVLALGHAVMGGGVGPRWWLALIGVAGIATGILTFLWPGVTALVLLFFIAGWSIALGVFEIVGAIRLRKEIDNEWTLILAGALSVLFGVALLVAPVAGILAVIWLLGAYAVVFGVLTIAFALKLRQRKPA
jgi:uncharacterized membrane protein HdeD (DUF308 family)